MTVAVSRFLEVAEWLESYNDRLRMLVYDMGSFISNLDYETEEDEKAAAKLLQLAHDLDHR